MNLCHDENLCCVTIDFSKAYTVHGIASKLQLVAIHKPVWG
jgi:hypothetical protein